MSTVVVSRRGADRIRAGHPWIYRSDIVSGDAAAGDLVAVTEDRARRLGWAFWSDVSQIALRLVTLDASAVPPDERTFFTARLRAAIEFRETLAIDSTAWRLVSGEADRLPGLVVDRYGDDTGTYLVMQTLSQGADRRRQLFLDILLDELHPGGVLLRNDPKVRRLEQLEPVVDVVSGAIPRRVSVREGASTFEVDLREGQKTGLFLDQRENHAVAGQLARGRTLDAFTYNGGFALAMARRADTVLALDSSAAAVAATAANARANGVVNVEAREANVFDELRELDIAGDRFDTVVLDPPAFAKNRGAVERAVAGYKEINLRALKLLRPGGHLVTCSCSYNISEATFLDVVHAAAADARATVALVEKRMQARDHPVLLGVPETYYLKCLVLRRVE